METALQEYLRNGGTPESLKEEFGINSAEHPKLPLTLFKYNQIDTGTEGNKTHEVIRASRGTVLENGTWDLVAQPFFRFFNCGEYIQEQRRFKWGNCQATSKEDGSAIIVYFYDGEWHANTSGSFGLDLCGFSNKTWRELFWDTSGIDTSKLNPELTYMFELCTIWNKVVRLYDTPRVYLLSVRELNSLREYETWETQMVADEIGVHFPEVYNFVSIYDVEEFLAGKEKDDPTFEGVVVRDSNNIRMKIKSKTYLCLHHLANNGNIANPKNIIPFVLRGEIDEVLTYFPELTKQVMGISAQLDAELNKLVNLYESVRHLESQKEFALAIVNETKFSSLLFNARKTGQAVEDLWRDSAELIHKTLFK